MIFNRNGISSTLLKQVSVGSDFKILSIAYIASLIGIDGYKLTISAEHNTQLY
jgi:hypothetical protein